MALDIESIFKATAQSTWLFLVTNGQGCYIPAYQRPYSWDKSNVSRLFEDALHGLSFLLKRQSAINFIGTIIAIHDTKHVTIKPVYKMEVPPRVVTIIDGQQRLCTLVMTNIVFHDLARALVTKFEKKKADAYVPWLLDQGKQLVADLEATILFDQNSGEGNYRYYPRIIRSYDDVWSKKTAQGKYESPIARLLWEYILHIKANGKGFAYKPKDANGDVPDSHKHVSDIFHFIQKETLKIISPDNDSKEFPELLAIIQSKDFQEAVWGFEVPAELKKYLTDQADHADYEDYTRFLRLLIFAHYINKRMAFTVVTTNSEDEAFDMFEALNTTGEPLTAFETFLPKVIEAETLANYLTSPSKVSVGRIEEYLEQYQGADAKQKAATDMLLPFALAETGTKMPKRLNDQRRYLREEFDSFKTIAEQRDFTERFSQVAEFLRHSWKAEATSTRIFNRLTPAKQADPDEVRFALASLRDINHQIVLAPLVRFYSEALASADDAAKLAGYNDLLAAVRATFAFSLLWRAAHGGTENIDSHYRDILRQGYPGEKISPLAKRPRDAAGAVSLMNYKKALRHILEKKGKITDKAAFVKLASKVPIYRNAAGIARLLIYIASDDAIPHTKVAGLLEAGRKDIAPMLTVGRWNNEDYFTVEHIAPASKSAGWDATIYDDHEAVNRLGNLILLPGAENNEISNKSWAHKRLMYGLLSADTQPLFDDGLKECQKVGLNFSKTAAEVFAEANYLSQCKSVASKKDDWSPKFIEERSENIAGLIWDKLYPWLV